MESKSVVTVLGLSPLYTIILSFIDDTQCIYFNMTCKKYYQNASVKLNGATSRTAKRRHAKPRTPSPSTRF